MNGAMKTMTTFIVLAMLAAAFISIAPTTNATDPDYDQNLGKFYSYTVQFVFTGSDAQSIDWNFGDGSAHSTEFHPSHVYAATGTYYVTQTVTNTVGSSTAVYRAEIMGFPLIFLDSTGGSSVESIQQTAYNVIASSPSEPTRSGYVFAGWYTDETCESTFDWTAGVTESRTLYAKWTSDGTQDNTPSDDMSRDIGKIVSQYLWLIFAGIATLLALAYVLGVRNIFLTVLMALSIILAVALYFGWIDQAIGAIKKMIESGS